MNSNYIILLIAISFSCFFAKVSFQKAKENSAIPSVSFFDVDDAVLNNGVRDVERCLTNENSSDIIKVEWEVLMEIGYELKYNSELDMEIYSPIFGEAQENLNGKEVEITGYVIPFDEDDEFLSLSANPYASCFFCGSASPASMISMYLKDKGKKYKIDDFKKFRGTLYLNQDDPNDFYYILKDAREG